MRKTLIACAIALALIVSTTGCRTSGSILRRWAGLEKQETQVKKDIATNQVNQTQQGRDFTYATGEALKHVTNEIPAVTLAKSLNSRAILTLGTPDYAEAIKLQAMVEDLLSANVKLVNAGQVLLKEQDTAIAKLQIVEDKLNAKLATVEQKKEVAADANAVDAAHYQKIRWFFIKILWAVGILLAIGIGCKVASFYPPLAPLGLVPDMAMGIVIKPVCAMLPHAITVAGGVTKKVYDEASTALTNVVGAVKDLKTSNPGAFASLATHLKDWTSNETSRPIIAAIDASLPSSKATPPAIPFYTATTGPKAA